MQNHPQLSARPDLGRAAARLKIAREARQIRLPARKASRSLILYYSRSGNTRDVAKSIARIVAADLAELGCGKYHLGLGGYARAVFEGVRGDLPEVDIPEAVLRPYDLVILCTPVWAGRPALPMRAFLAGKPSLPARTAILMTHKGSPPERPIAEMSALLPVPPVAALAIRSRDIRKNRAEEKLRDFATRLDAVAA